MQGQELDLVASYEESDMSNPNVLGFVVEVDEGRDEEGNPKVRLKLNLKNTLGRSRVIWVDAPPEVADFYSSDLSAGL